ncbi:nSTAND1 domain-containing NTPase [Nonomuraea sp. LPB2021202275-12-8]|uniref:nSTAND1 domain-containing NTPase n=1 Tax=Nonomuraea sp. LPB2021202275-12-8 TaxID=3120159 RepID=UPI00300CD4A8
MGRRETPVDPGSGPVQQFALELRKLRQEAGGITYRVMAKRAGYSVSTLSQAAAGERLATLPVVLAYVEACGADREEWEERWRQAAEDAALRFAETDDEDAPYLGLTRFETTDRHRFFGRDRLVSELLDLVSRRRFVAVFGPSGIGKSSMLRAGLVPAVSERWPAGGRPGAIRLLTPGERPARTHGTRLKQLEDGAELLVLIDQFEEVFTLCRDPAERAEFVDMVVAAGRAENRTRVVIAVRADFYGRCAEHRALAEALQEANLLVGPMSGEELREAIVKPAMAEGLTVERALTARVVREVAGEPGGLPLMSHALLETWRRRRGKVLTAATYTAAGGVRGALARTAERVYLGLTSDQAAQARRILLRLVDPGTRADGEPQDTRRPAAHAEIVTGRADAALVLERLAGARLVTIHEDTVEIAHEALIASWPRLREWIEDQRDRLHAQRRLGEAAAIWAELGRDPGALYRGARLAAARELLMDGPQGQEGADLTALERDFLDAGIALSQRRSRRRRRLVTVLATLLVASLAGGGLSAHQAGRIAEQRDEARGRELAHVAGSLRTTDPVRGTLLSVAAWRLAPGSVESRAGLMNALHQPEADLFRDPPVTGVTARAVSGDGGLLASASQDGVRVYDVRTGRRLASWPATALGGGVPQRAALSRSGRLVAVSTLDRVAVWDSMTGRLRGERTVPPGPEPMRPVFDGHDSVLALLYGPSVHLLWDADRDRSSAPGWEEESTSQVSLSGQVAAVAGADGVNVWTLDRSRPRFTVRCGGHESAAVSPDGTTLACGGARIELWDVRTGRPLDRPRAPEQWPWDPTGTPSQPGDHKELRFSPDARFLIGVDGPTIRVWRVADQREVLRYRAGGPVAGAWADPDGHTVRYLLDDAVVSLDLSPPVAPAATLGDGLGLDLSPEARWLAVRARGAQVRIWDVQRRRFAGALPDVVTALPVVFDPRGRTTVTREQGGLIRVWDVPGLRELWRTRIPEEESSGEHVAFSPDGRTLAAVSYRPFPPASYRLRLWDARSGRRLSDVPLDGDTGEITFSRDGRSLVTSSGRLVDVATGRPTGLSYSAGGLEHVTEVAVSPAGGLMATSGGSNRVALWNVRGPAALPPTVQGSPGRIEHLAFAPAGDVLATAGADTVRLWDVASRQGLGEIVRPGGRFAALAFSPDGGTLHAADDDGAVYELPVAPSRLARAVCGRAGRTLTEREWREHLPDLAYQDVCHP